MASNDSSGGTFLGFNPKTFLTLEFLLVVVSNVAGWALALVGYLPDRWAVYVTALSGALYAVSRGLAKLNADTRDYWQTTEFWIALLASVPAVVAAFQDTIDAQTYGVIQTVIVLATGIGAGLRKQPQLAAGDPVIDGDLFGGTEPDVVDPAKDHVDDVPVTPPAPRRTRRRSGG